MKKVLVMSVILVMCAAGGASAAYKGGEAGVTVDGSLAVATQTYSGSGAAVGFAVGVSYDLENLVKLREGKFLARADISSFAASKDEVFASLDSTRMPLFVGARYVLPFRTEPLNLFVEVGLELSFDKHEALFPGLLAKYSVSETNLGVAPGFGVFFPIGSNMVIGADARLHVLSNSYTSFMFSLGYNF